MTPNKEDYLKMIYEIGETEGKINNKRIAERMEVSAPSASEMIKKLVKEDLIVKDKKLGYYLTKKGLLLVSELYRKHRLIEIFLLQHLHYTIDEVHAEAEILEHTVSTFFIDRLEESLGFPTFCPHGGTIPKKGELLVEINHHPLSQAAENGFYRISRIHDDFELLKYLETHQLTIGETVELLDIDSFAKTHTVAYAGQELAIPDAIAKQIYVTAVED